MIKFCLSGLLGAVVLLQPDTALPTGAAPGLAPGGHGAGLIRENIVPLDAALSERLQAYQNTRSAIFTGHTVDGGALIISRFAESPQVHFVAAAGGMRRQLTFSKEPVNVAVPSPVNPDLFVFLQDEGGNEAYQVFLFDRSNGRSQLLSDGKNRKSWPTWSSDGNRLAWVTTQESGESGIVVYSLADPGQRQIVYSAPGAWFPISWSPNDQLISLYHFRSLDDSQVHLLDLAQGKVSQVNPSEQKIGYGRVAFTADSSRLLLAMDQGLPNLALHEYSIASGESVLLDDGSGYDIEYIAAAADGKTYAYTINADGRSQLRLRAANHGPLTVPDAPLGVISGLQYSPDSLRLGMTIESASSPGDLWMLELAGAVPHWIPWVESETGGIPPDQFIQPRIFSYPTFDKSDTGTRQIPAFIYKPRNAGPHPVIISLHGGPSFQSRLGFSSDFQFWARELGVAVIVPNVRGSTGYGKVYESLDNQRLREDSVRDVGALLDWIESQPDLDAKRVMVHGASYGGYLVLASLVHFSDRLAGGIDIVGISDFVTFLESTAEYRRDQRRPEYGDERDPEMRAFLKQISPLTHAHKIRAPLFIVQGLNDPRVPASEALQIKQAVQSNGQEVWYLAAPDEGHGFQKKGNVDEMREAIAAFISRFLLE